MTTILDMKKEAIESIVEKSVNSLSKGNSIVFPTETSYGLGADATNARAVEKVIAIKKQPAHKEISVIVDSLETIQKYGEISTETEKLIKHSFPGPITFIIPKKDGALNALPGNTVAFRIPPHGIAFELALRFGKPITATSANLHGKPPIYTGREAIETFTGAVDLIIDAGILPHNHPSTLFDITHKKVVREGTVTEEEILDVLG
jgi:L-threonylcarbamoyladenylate synthase